MYIRRSDAIRSVLGITMLQGRVPMDTVIYRITSIPAVEPCKDAVSRADVIKEIGNAFDMGDCYCDRHSMIGLMFSLPSVTVEPNHGEWIPCSERLPKRQGHYICTCKDGSKYKRTTVVKWSNGWQLTGTRSYWIVLAWMPLPEPWKGADDE